VKLAIGGLKVTFNEFLVQPVSKLEFESYSKVISEFIRIRVNYLSLINAIFILDSAKFDEYKNRTSATSNNRLPDAPSPGERREASEEDTSNRKYNPRSRSRKRSISSKHKSSKKSQKKSRYASTDSQQQRSSDDNDRRHKKKSKKSKQRRSRS